ncbi:hypothetical protein Ahy_A09g046304 [Arachis hypogaea]|uniref:Uncharacterized protein n=1 Tax=Arachis hypogaea TaxID=3818 RepID=A0A445BPI8_ARAHY|nr:hypothetical protein Ahy_A09g046304 [Arachis hypogaea]
MCFLTSSLRGISHLSNSSNNTIIASEAGTKERENRMLQIFTPSYRVYIHHKFREVKAQFRGKVNRITRSTNSALGYSIYQVVEQVSNSTFNNSPSEMPVLIIRVKRDIVPSLPKRVKL